jgi:UDP-glucose 4-epimerase
MNILITGGSGFIGSHLIKYLRDKGYNVLNVDIASQLSSEKIDIREYNALKKIFEYTKPNVVVHLAAIASVPQCEYETDLCFSTNVIGTLNIAKLSKNFNAKLVFASSAAVYGKPEILPIPVAHPLRPNNFYGLTKLLGEFLVRYYLPDNHVIFRIFNVYGENCKRSYVIPDTIKKIMKKMNPVPMKGTGEEERDFVYVKDACEAFYTAINTNVVGTFNLGTGRKVKIKELARMIAELMGFEDIKFMFEGKKRIGDMDVLHADISNGNSLPGWSPKTGLEEGLKKTIEWYMKNLSD